MSVLNVLIAEDDPVTAEILEYLIKEEGHGVCGIVAQGADVLENVHALRPDVVLMDVHLADGVSGISVTREKLQHLSVPVIIISATDSPEELRDIAESGALGFLKKPVTPEELHVNLRIAMHHNEVMRKLQMSELLHRSFFDDAAVGIYVCNRDGKYVASNQAYAKMLGYSGPADLLRMIFSMDEQVYADEGRRAALLAELEKGHVLSDEESRVYGKDGDLLWVSEHLTPVFDDDGRMAHYEGVAINISDKKQAENDRNTAYTLMQITMDAIPDYVVVTDLDGYIIFANQAFERDLGELVGSERLLEFQSTGSCPLARFRDELPSEQAPGHQVRGYCRISGHQQLLSIGITRYPSPEGETLGMVFVMHPVHDKNLE